MAHLTKIVHLTVNWVFKWHIYPKMVYLSKNGTLNPKWHIYPRMAHLSKEGYRNGGSTEQFSDLKSSDIGNTRLHPGGGFFGP